MEITLAMVTSLDGRITDKNGEVYSWTSAEDQARYAELRKGYPLIIMGRKTYEEIKPKLVLTPDRLRLVMTRDATKHQDEQVTNRLEFTSLSPTELVQDLERRGYQRALLAGGSEVNKAFFDSGLVTRLILTIEPVILSDGLPLVAGGIEGIRLELEKMEQLNEQGTLHCEYRVLRK